VGLRSVGITHPKLEEHIFDLSEIDAHPEAFVGTDFFCALGTTIKKVKTRERFFQVDHDFVVSAARAALAGGAQRACIVSSVSASASSTSYYLRVKGQMEDALRALDIPSVGFFRPGLLRGARNERRIGEEIGNLFMPAINLTLLGPLRRYRGIQGRDVARAMVRFSQSNPPPGAQVLHHPEMMALIKT